jgi:hypothetical protein
MSPLWSDLALARAALDDAVQRGLFDEKRPRTRAKRRFKASARLGAPHPTTPTPTFAL